MTLKDYAVLFGLLGSAVMTICGLETRFAPAVFSSLAVLMASLVLLFHEERGAAIPPRMKDVLRGLDTPKKFSELQKDARMSTSTLSKHLGGGCELGLIEKVGDMYQRTSRGTERVTVSTAKRIVDALKIRVNSSRSKENKN